MVALAFSTPAIRLDKHQFRMRFASIGCTSDAQGDQPIAADISVIGNLETAVYKWDMEGLRTGRLARPLKSSMSCGIGVPLLSRSGKRRNTPSSARFAFSRASVAPMLATLHAESD